MNGELGELKVTLICPGCGADVDIRLKVGIALGPARDNTYLIKVVPATAARCPRCGYSWGLLEEFAGD